MFFMRDLSPLARAAPMQTQLLLSQEDSKH